MLINAIEGLAAVDAVVVQMRDGDGSQASHYDLAVSQVGFQAGDYAEANTAAQSSHSELMSLLAKVNTDASVSNVRAAVYQFAAKHGVIN
jgi:phosphoribosylformylglycinamidine (FGAM) synthase-like amidotransferase family enzyme